MPVKYVLNEHEGASIVTIFTSSRSSMIVDVSSSSKENNVLTLPWLPKTNSSAGIVSWLDGWKTDL